MKIEKIDYKITTTDKLKCHRCKKAIDGKEGYIKITTKRERGYNQFGGTDGMLRICWGCFEKSLKDIFKNRENREENYNKLLKRRILTGLR